MTMLLPAIISSWFFELRSESGIEIGLGRGIFVCSGMNERIGEEISKLWLVASWYKTELFSSAVASIFSSCLATSSTSWLSSSRRQIISSSVSWLLSINSKVSFTSTFNFRLPHLSTFSISRVKSRWQPRSFSKDFKESSWHLVKQQGLTWG